MIFMNNTLWISLVFTGLSKPPMVLGVTIEYLFIVSIIPIFIVSFTGSALWLLMLVPFHLLGWILCRIDAHIFRILLKRLACTATPNNKLWGCQSYEPY